MKTTIEIPEPLFTRAKLRATRRRSSLKSTIVEALERLLASDVEVTEEPSLQKLFGAFKASKDETKNIQTIIDSELSTINKDDWK